MGKENSSRFATPQDDLPVNYGQNEHSHPVYRKNVAAAMKPDPCLSDPPDAKGTEEGANDTAVQATVTDIQKSHRLNRNHFRAQELCECQGGRPGLRIPNSPYGVCGRKATLN